MSASSSILLITVDCLRADHVGFLGYARPTTPFLDSLRKDSAVFQNAIVAGAPTYYSFPAILASRYPLALGRDILGLAPGEPTLASTLRDAGYATAAFTAANPYLSPRFGYDQGFDVFEDFLQGPPLGEIPEPSGNRRAMRINQALRRSSSLLPPTRKLYDELYFRYCQRRVSRHSASFDRLRRFPSADTLVDRACSWVASVNDRPFFLWLHFMDPHAPYYPPEHALQLMGDRISPAQARYLNSYWLRSDLTTRRFRKHLQEITALYDAGIRWVDTQIARLVSELQHTSRWHDCIFALTADHGEEFLDHGGRYHPPDRLSEEILRVPLLLRAPSLSAHSLHSPFSLIHLAPTLLDAAGVSSPVAFQGLSRWPRIQSGQLQLEEELNGSVIAESITGSTNPFRSEDRFGSRVLVVRDGRYKLCVTFSSPLTADLFDLDADPGERSPTPGGQSREIRHRLLQQALAHVEQSRTQRDSSVRLAARLRDLQLEWANPDSILQTAGL